MMKIKYLFLLLACSVMVFGFNFERNAEIQASGNSIKIGVIASLSAENNTAGLKGLEGIEIMQQLNPHLANGDLIEVIVMDDVGLGEESINALKEMSTVHKVSAILLLSDSDTVLAVAKVANQYQIPILAINASHPNVTKKSKYITQFNFDDGFQASAAALFIRDELFLQKAAIFVDSDNMHFSFLVKEFARQFIEAEGEITDTINLKDNKDELMTVLQLMQQKNPELLYIQVPFEETMAIVMALNEMEWSPRLMVSDGVLASILTQDQIAIDSFDDVLATETFYSGMDLTVFGKRVNKKIKSMDFDRNEVVTHTLLGVEGYAFLLQAMNRCDDPKDRLCVNNKIRSTKKFEGIMGYISIDYTGKANRALVINKIKDEQMNFIVKVY